MSRWRDFYETILETIKCRCMFFYIIPKTIDELYNVELRKQETEQYQRVKYKVQLCPEKYLPAIESAIDELMKLDK